MIYALKMSKARPVIALFTIGLIVTFCFNPNFAFAERIGKYRIVINKSKRQLSVFSGPIRIKTFPIALGSSPNGTKIKEGDRKTPEGAYYICGKNRQSKFTLSIAISYPNVVDARRALASKLISKTQYNQIFRANRQHQKPPQHTPLGGDIFIHGGGTATDWTWGCIALEDKDIKWIFREIPVGAKMEIRR